MCRRAARPVESFAHNAATASICRRDSTSAGPRSLHLGSQLVKAPAELVRGFGVAVRRGGSVNSRALVRVQRAKNLGRRNRVACNRAGARRWLPAPEARRGRVSGASGEAGQASPTPASVCGGQHHRRKASSTGRLAFRGRRRGRQYHTGSSHPAASHFSRSFLKPGERWPAFVTQKCSGQSCAAQGAPCVRKQRGGVTAISLNRLATTGSWCCGVARRGVSGGAGVRSAVPSSGESRSELCGFPSDRFHVLGGVVTNGSFFLRVSARRAPACFRFPASPGAVGWVASDSKLELNLHQPDRDEEHKRVSARLGDGLVNYDAIGRQLRVRCPVVQPLGIVLSGGRGCLRGIGVPVLRLSGWAAYQPRCGSSSLGRCRKPPWPEVPDTHRFTFRAGRYRHANRPAGHGRVAVAGAIRSGPAALERMINNVYKDFKSVRTDKEFRVFDTAPGSDAVDWLQSALSKNPSFGSNRRRHQVCSCSASFTRAASFTMFAAAAANSKYDTEPFEDSSSRLYKFSLVETTLSPLSARQPSQAMGLPGLSAAAASCRAFLVRQEGDQPLSASSSASGGAACATPAQPGSGGGAAGQEEEDLAYIWLDSALTRMRELLELRSIDALTDARQLRADFVRDNLTSAGQAGTRPIRCRPGLPSYEGFELEIFAELCEFFEGRDAEPLVPPDLRDLFINRAGCATPPARRRHRRRFRRHPIGAPAMTSSCAEIMRQLTRQPGASATDDADCSDANWSLMNQPPLRLARVCHSDCEFDAEDDGGGRRRLRRLPPPPPLAQTLSAPATSEADGLGREQELLQSVQDPGNAADGGVHPLDGDSLLASGLQLAALFFAPGRRRRLHQLLRAMHKLGANPRLRLDPVLPTAHVVLHSLASCVLRRKPEVREPRHPQSEQPDVFALQLFSLSGRLASDQALLNLLEGLLSDENLPAREKRPQAAPVQGVAPRTCTRPLPGCRGR
uniref:DEP domain-containing protein n=1 Tax=Macrostomum lignano TaxID=282301 RepID=A0A1I8F4R0_9PLAT